MSSRITKSPDNPLLKHLRLDTDTQAIGQSRTVHCFLWLICIKNTLLITQALVVLTLADTQIWLYFQLCDFTFFLLVFNQVIQLFETMLVRHGVMLVGPTGGGKTTVYTVLADVLETLYRTEHKDTNPFYQPVKTYILNPKSVTMGELYGEVFLTRSWVAQQLLRLYLNIRCFSTHQVNPLTLEWCDGLMALSVRDAVNDTSDEHKWVICDGPVDALWIENMNTVLDDNKMLCLANSERIKLTPSIHMMFEVRADGYFVLMTVP